MVYPVILISLAVVLVGIIVLKVVPAFADFYAGSGRSCRWQPGSSSPSRCSYSASCFGL